MFYATFVLAEQYALFSEVFRVDNVKHVHGPSVCSLNTAPSLCVGDAILVVII